MPKKKVSKSITREAVVPVVSKHKGAWSDEEKWVACELTRLGAKGSRIAPFLMRHYKTKRTPHSVWSLTWKLKDEKVPQAVKDLVKSQGLLAKTLAMDIMKQPKGDGSRRKMKLSKPAPAEASLLQGVAAEAGLSKSAQKALEAKLVVHRFRLETPHQSIELAVSGTDAMKLFTRMIGVISTPVV